MGTSGVFAVDVQPEIAQERDIGISRRIVRGQQFVAVEDRIGAGEETERLALACDAGATGGQANARLRQGQARDGYQPNEFKNIDRRLFAQRRPGHGHEAIDRHAFRGRIEVVQHFEHAQAVVFRFAHADDAAATDGHPAFLHGGDGLEAITEGVGADDLRVKFRRRVDVVIVSGHPGGAEFARFDRTDLAERDANFHAELADFAHGLEHLLKLRCAIAHAFPGRAHAEASSALCACAFRGSENVGKREQIFALQTGRVMRTLRAVAAIFAATAGLDAEQTAALHLLTAPMLEMQRAALRNQIEERLAVERGELVEVHRRSATLLRKIRNQKSKISNQ